MELTDAQFAELQELIAKNKGAQEPVQQATTPQPFSIKLGEQSFTVRDQDEAQRLIDQYDAQRVQQIEAERVQTEAARQRTQQLEQQYQPRQAQADGFSNEEYARLFLEDPRKANRYALQHDPEQLQFYSGLVSQLSAVKQEAAASQFLLQHRDDYVPNGDNFKALNSIITQFNLPWDINGMNLAFAVGKAQGLISAGETEQNVRQQVDDSDAGDEQQFVPVPRTPRRRSNVNTADAEAALENFEKLSPEAMKNYLEKLAR